MLPGEGRRYREESYSPFSSDGANGIALTDKLKRAHSSTIQIQRNSWLAQERGHLNTWKGSPREVSRQCLQTASKGEQRQSVGAHICDVNTLWGRLCQVRADLNAGQALATV